MAEALLGVGTVAVIPTSNKASATRDSEMEVEADVLFADIEQASGAKQLLIPAVVSLFGGEAGHLVVVTKIRDGRVYFFEPNGLTGGPPGTPGFVPGSVVESAERSEFSMPLDQFKSMACWLLAGE
ncbi:hypothetical protein ACFL6C_13580 [Myxococcota bacterium]